MSNLYLFYHSIKQIDAAQEILLYFYFTMSNYLILVEVFVFLIIFILILVFIIAMFVIGVLIFSCLLSFVVSQNCSRQRWWQLQRYDRSKATSHIMSIFRFVGLSLSAEYISVIWANAPSYCLLCLMRCLWRKPTRQ